MGKHTVKVRNGNTTIDIRDVAGVEKMTDAVRIYMLNGIVVNIRNPHPEDIDRDYTTLRTALDADLKRRASELTKDDLQKGATL